MFPSLYIYGVVCAVIVTLIASVSYFKNKAKVEKTEKDLLSVKINTQNENIDKLASDTANNQTLIDNTQTENKKQRELSDKIAIEKFNKVTDIDTAVNNAINDVNKES